MRGDIKREENVKRKREKEIKRKVDKQKGERERETRKKETRKVGQCGRLLAKCNEKAPGNMAYKKK